jgi:hypothetical protein
MEVVPTFNYTIKSKPELEKFFLFDLILHFRSFKICFVFRIKVILVHKILYSIFLSEKKLSILAKKTWTLIFWSPEPPLMTEEEADELLVVFLGERRMVHQIFFFKKKIWANDMLSISQGKEEEEETNTWR